MCVITPPGSDDEHHQNKESIASKEQQHNDRKVLMSATVGTSKMEVINGQDKNLYATVQTVTSTTTNCQKGQFFIFNLL